MTWIPVLNTTGVDLRFRGTDGILPADDFGAVDNTATIVIRGLAVGALVQAEDIHAAPVLNAVARCAALNAGLPGATAGPTLAERVVAAEAAVAAVNGRISALEADHIELDPSGTPVLVTSEA